MSGNAKRNLVVGTMAVLVCAAVGLNWKYSTQEALQQAEETGTKILGEATLVSGQEGTELAEDTVYEGDDYFASARLTRQHNDANMMALGAGITGGNLAKRMVEIFLHTEFEGGRHARRVALLDAIQ